MVLHLMLKLISSSIKMYGERWLSGSLLMKTLMASRDNYYFLTTIPTAVCPGNLALFCTKFHLALFAVVFLSHFCLRLLIIARRNHSSLCFSPLGRHLLDIRPSLRVTCRFLLERGDCYRKPLLTKQRIMKFKSYSFKTFAYT